MRKKKEYLDYMETMEFRMKKYSINGKLRTFDWEYMWKDLKAKLKEEK